MRIKQTLSTMKWWNLTKARNELLYANHKRRMIHEAFRKVLAWDISGSYMEFGTYRGQSVVYAYQEKSALFKEINTKGISRIYAFDSFQGVDGLVPEEIDGPFAKGSYSSSYKEYREYLVLCGVPVEDITTVIGFFQDSLTLELQSLILEENPVVAVLNIDCDIYLPALLALRFAKDMFRQGTMVLFDDWYSYGLDPGKGEVRALSEFLGQNKNLDFIFWKDYGPAGRSFIVSLNRSNAQAVA